YVRLGAIVLLPCLAACLAARYALEWQWASVWVLAVALGGVFQGAFTMAAGELLFAPTASLGRILLRFARRLPSYLAALVLSRMLIGLGALVLVLFPVFWLRVLFVHEVSLLENASPVQAIRRASRFVKRQGNAAAGLWLCLLLAQAGFLVVGELVGASLVE